MASALVCCRAGPATGLQRKLSTRERQPITAIGPLSPPAAGRHRRRRCRSTPGASRRPVVCTSEHWYEEEDEFDAMTGGFAADRLKHTVEDLDTGACLLPEAQLGACTPAPACCLPTLQGKSAAVLSYHSPPTTHHPADAMHPKTVVLVAAASGTDVDEAAVQQLRPYLQPLDFAQAFSGEQVGLQRPHNLYIFCS